MRNDRTSQIIYYVSNVFLYFHLMHITDNKLPKIHSDKGMSLEAAARLASSYTNLAKIALDTG